MTIEEKLSEWFMNLRDFRNSGTRLVSMHDMEILEKSLQEFEITKKETENTQTSEEIKREGVDEEFDYTHR